jgi:MFS family permease
MVRMLATRLAVSTLFFVNGAVLASWLPHIPAVKARLTSGDGQLGLVLLAMAAGAVVALPMAGWLVGLAGSRLVSSLSAAGICLVMPLPVLSPSLPALVVVLAVFGALNALLDVSMNAQAAAVETRVGRPIMSSFHALFSLGGVVGALLASAALAAGVGVVGHVLAAATVALAAVVAAIPRLLPSAPEPTGAALARPTRALAGLGLLALLGLLAEGAMADWSAVYLHDTLGASSSVAAVGFAAFSLAMAAGRFGGDALVQRLGPRRVLRVSGAVAAGGLGLALLLGRPVAGILGCALVGAGIANIVPVIFSAATRVPGLPPGHGLAAVATTGYLGFLTGPPVIGAVAEVAGLAVGLGLVSLACAVVAVGARSLPDAHGRPVSERRGLTVS